MQNWKAEQKIQAIYKAILNITETTSEGLASMIKALEQIEKQLAEIYKKNANMVKLTAKQPMTTPTNDRAQSADKVQNAQVLVAGLDNIHRQLTAELFKVRNMVSFLVGSEGSDNPKLRNHLDTELTALGKLNEQYTAAYRMIQRQVVILGDMDVAKNVIGKKEINAMNTQLETLAKKVQVMKLQITGLNKQQKASNEIPSMFSKRSGP